MPEARRQISICWAAFARASRSIHLDRKLLTNGAPVEPFASEPIEAGDTAALATIDPLLKTHRFRPLLSFESNSHRTCTRFHEGRAKKAATSIERRRAAPPDGANWEVPLPIEARARGVSEFESLLAGGESALGVRPAEL